MLMNNKRTGIPGGQTSKSNADGMQNGSNIMANRIAILLPL